jgi:hypothetical protein
MLNDKVLAEQIGLSKKCGYWEINGNYFFDKFECLRYATKIKRKDVKYHFYDSVYQTLDWSKEPSQSLEQLYIERAKQLRDSYDYLILSFSGGADSSNILRIFIDNHIKLDEVYCEYPIPILEKFNTKMSVHNKSPELVLFEWYTAAEPALKSLAKTNPEIKISIHSIVEECVEMIEKGDLHKHKRGGSINPILRFDRLYSLAKSRTIFGTVGCINGLDKPRIAYNPSTDKFISVFSDFSNAFSEFSTYAFSEYQIAVEQFYNTSEHGYLNQKMCFAIKNSLVNLDKDSDFYKSLLSHITPTGVHVYDIHKDYFKKILYSKWNTNIWQANKTGNIFYSPLLQWFFDKNITSHRTREFYEKQLAEQLHGIDSEFITYNNDTAISLVFYTTTGTTF